jgi:hypothetical protein
MRICLNRYGFFVALFAAAALLAGCGELKVRVGNPVAPLLIESGLTIGQSSARDVLQLLGQPLGMGREFLPFHARPRSVWS